ncbi:MAG: hypothetical protein IJW79_05230 [Clostridia bacterium]|nr:hypothetical protein [Clostridia bacterium]
MDFHIQNFGAVGDGKTLNTSAIQSAIDACAEVGGGRVIVSGGSYMTGTIILKSNVDLHIEADGVLYGSPNCDDYPEFAKKHMDYTRGPRHRGAAMIFAEECENISITGKGKIDGHGDAFIEKIPDGTKSWMPYRRINAPTPPRVVLFTGCQNILVENVTITNQPAGWSYWIHDCDHVNFSRVKIIANLDYPNNDGIHVNCSRNVTISDSIISCGDDCIIVRANSRSLKENKVCEKVTVTNCTLTSHSSGIRIGWVNDGTIRNCTFSNIVMTDTTVGIGILLPPKKWASTGDYGCEKTLIENLSFSNIVMDRNYSPPIYIHLYDDEETECEGIRDLYFDNIHSCGLELPYICGRKSTPIKNIYFTNCTFKELNREIYDDGKPHGGVKCRDKDPHAIIFSNTENIVLNNTSFTTQ